MYVAVVVVVVVVVVIVVSGGNVWGDTPETIEVLLSISTRFFLFLVLPFTSVSGDYTPQ